MAIINNINEKLHRMKVKLYPTCLPKLQGRYIARTNSEASLNIEELCTYLNNRGGFADNYENLLQHVRQFFDEAAYQLCNGFSVNLGYFTIHPNIGGTFDANADGNDLRKHRISFRFHELAPLRRLTEHIIVEIEGIYDGTGWIEEFIDIDGDLAGNEFSPGNQFCITGQKIKVAGDDESCGVFFVPVDDPSKAVKVKRLAENNPTKIIGRAPCTGHNRNWLEIRTQFNGSSGSFLKKLRVIKSDFILEAV